MLKNNPTTNSFPKSIPVRNRRHLLAPDDEFHTVIEGERITTGQPCDFEKTAHVYGACTVAGSPWIENNDTTPSAIQAKLAELGYSRVLVDNSPPWVAVPDQKTLICTSCITSL